MTNTVALPEGNPIIRISKNRAELVWPNGERLLFHSPEVQQAQRELNRVMRLRNLGRTASLQQRQNYADSVFEVRTQLAHAVNAFVKSCRGNVNLMTPTAQGTGC